MNHIPLPSPAIVGVYEPYVNVSREWLNAVLTALETAEDFTSGFVDGSPDAGATSRRANSLNADLNRLLGRDA